MGTLGRRSTAELMVAEGPHGAVANRPDPPRDLDEAEATEWCAIVASMPPSYFGRSHYPTQLCRHVVAANRVAMLLAECRKQKKLDLREYAKLLAMQLKESTYILRLSRSMRLTHQANYRADSKKQRPVLFKPWERNII